MRTMRRSGTDLTVTVVKHIILRNFWEYYITTDKHNKDIVRAVVMGHEVELGDISLSEIMPYAIMQTTNLAGIMPAPNWEWVDKIKYVKLSDIA